MRTHNLQYWPVFLRQDGELAGCAGLRPYGDDPQVLELGFHFRPQYWERGWCTRRQQRSLVSPLKPSALTAFLPGMTPGIWLLGASY